MPPSGPEQLRREVRSSEGPATEVAAVLRWAGSKRWLVRQGVKDLVGEVEGTYFEPFLGSASIFLSLHPARAVLSDLNERLIAFYLALQEDASEVSRRLESMKFGPEMYYEVRSDFPSGDRFTAAAQFIYLNTFCFNGLYRENRSGKFNVPYGRPKTSNVPAKELLAGLGQRLGEGVSLGAWSFNDALSQAGSGDTIYLDPPYVSGHRYNGFVDYNSHLFTWDDQVRLSGTFRKLDRDGARVFMSNADHESVLSLYPGMRILRLTRFSSMASSSAARGATNEVIITNVIDGPSWPS